MEEWRKYKLKDFIEFNPKEKVPQGELCRKISMDQITPFTRFVESNIYEVYKGGAKFRNYDTIMARITPCLENGKTAYISSLHPEEVAVGSTEYIVLRKRENISDSKFIFYLAISPIVRDIAIKSMVGSSGRQRVQQDVLENYEIPIPSLPTQKNIAHILSVLDDKIELNKRINDNLEQQAQALFKSWFVDFEPFKNGQFVDSELGKIPEGWKVGYLSEIADIIMGQSPNGSTYNENGEGIIFYQGRAEFGTRFPSIRLFTTNPTRIAPANSILISVRAPVGDINITHKECCIGRGLASAVSRTNKSAFLLYTLFSLKSDLDKFNAEGTVFGSINRKALETLKILIPTNDLISKFEAIVASMDQQILILHIESENLKILRDTLLPKLMSGELSVNS